MVGSWRTPIGPLDIDDVEFSYDMRFDSDPIGTIVLCRVFKGAIEDQLPHKQSGIFTKPEMFTKGEAAAIGALDDMPFSGYVHRANYTAIRSTGGC